MKGQEFQTRLPLTTAIHVLTYIGPEAKEAIPALKKLKLHESESIRKLATEAIEWIDRLSDKVQGGAEDGPKSRTITLPAQGKVTHKIAFRKDGLAVVWVDGDGSTSFDVQIFGPASEQLVASSQGANSFPGQPLYGHFYLTWQPVEAGVYRIEIRNLGAHPGRCRLKHN